MERRFERILADPVWLVLLVTLLIGLPVIVVGEAAGADARARLRAAEANAAALGAERAAAGISDQLRRARDLIFAATQAPNTGKLPPLAAAARAGDRAAIQQQLETLRSVLAPALPEATVGEMVVLDVQNVVVTADTATGQTSIQAVSRDQSGRPYVGITTAAAPVAISPVFRISRGAISLTAGPSSIAMVAGLADPATKDSFGSLVAVMNPSRFGADLLLQVPPVDEAYLLDARGRLIVRASRPNTTDPNVLEDLGGLASPRPVAPHRGERRA